MRFHSLFVLIFLVLASVAFAVPPVDVADLSIAVSDSPDPVDAGTNLIYHITVTNAGPDTAKNVEVTDALPSGVSFVSGTNCLEAAGTVTCTLGNLTVGATSFDLTVLVAPSAFGVINNTVSVASTHVHASDPDTSNNSAQASTTVNSTADVSITKSDSADPVLPGAGLAYTVTATNNGPSTAANVTITDTLPAGVTFVSAPGCSEALGVVTCSAGTISPGNNSVFVINVTTPASPQMITNSATVASSTSDNNMGNNSASEDTLVDAIPVADDQSASTDEDTDLPITVTASDGDSDSLTYSLLSGPTHGGLTGTLPDVTYMPDADYNGPDSFTFNVNDGLADSNTATVSITVDPINDAPTADDQSVNTDEDTSAGIIVTGGDVDGDPISFELVSGPSNGGLSGTLPNVTYMPNGNFHGNDSFTFKTNDGNLDSNTATVSITVQPVNDLPTADSQSVNTDEDTDLNIMTTALDVDGDPLTWILVSGPSNGQLTGTLPNVTYTPDQDFNGADSFTFKVNDGSGDSNDATVMITVDPVNDAPEANDDNYEVDEDNTLNIPADGVLGNDTDVENDSLTASFDSGAAHGTVTLNPDGSFEYVPDGDYNGDDSFTYIANDGSDDSSPATVHITVHAVNDDPDAVDDPAETDENTPVTVSVLDNDSDVDGDTVSITSVTQGTSGSVTDNGDGTVTYTPDTDFFGSDSFTYTIEDGNGGSDTATVNVTVNEVIPPVDISIDDVMVNEPLSGSVMATLTVTLSGPSTVDVTVDFETVADTATAGSDYVSTSGQLTIPAGETSGTIDVEVLADSESFEGSETCFVHISNPVNGTITDDQGTLTIVDTCLFCDDFETGGLATDWTYIKPNWSETGGNLIGTPASRKAIAIASPVFGGCLNCSVNATLQSAGGIGNRVWMLGWYVDKKNTVELLMKEENDKWILKQRVNGTIVAKNKGFGTILPNVSYDVKVAFDGATFQVTVDGNLILQLNAAPGLNAGTVGFQAKSTTGTFGQIIVN